MPKPKFFIEIKNIKTKEVKRGEIEHSNINHFRGVLSSYGWGLTQCILKSRPQEFLSEYKEVKTGV